nr:serine/threonine kinase-like domain-containing protein STKLD1 [Ciona intestinalis]|eukprot:XP_018670905.1 serine/threonine kinase-like domain-containing protein STKLD1 [Ciona intestinalis]
MENYKLLQRLGRGAQGSVYLVEHKEDKAKYVLKKVECNDESEANKAFKEAMALQELRHQFVCGYKEFFVTWDREESAMFVCIVMDYYELGDLAKVLKTKRVKQENIDEMILRKWLGQMVEALVFVHNKKVIHRDLKPSNIFMTKNLSICIGDFGVATVMGDARTRTRTTVGSMNWMAPEVMERPYDERSDVWSLGCILLELATCSFLDPVQISGSLFEIKQNPQCLEDILCELPKHKYSPHLCQLIRTMLRRNFQQRPTAVELLAFPYVKECLLLNPDSELVEKKKVFTPPKDAFPKGKSVQMIFSYMTKNSENEAAQKEAFKHLAFRTQKKDFAGSMTTAMKKKIVKLMEQHMDCSDVQLHGYKILLNLVELSSSDREVFYKREMIRPVLVGMRSHPTSEQLQSTACSLIMTLSADEDAADIIGQAGGVQDILSAMRQFTNKPDICSTCCGALWSLSVNESNARIVTEEKGLQDVCNAMETHANSSELIESACSAIWSLSLEDDNVDILSDVAISLIIESMEKHVTKVKVVKSALMALASIVTCGEECAYRVLSPSNDVTGLKVITDAMTHHKNEVDIAESFCTLLLELTEYDDVVNEMKSPSLKIKQIVANLRKQFRSNEEISGSTEVILSKFGVSAPRSPQRPPSARSRPRSAARNR